MYRNGDERNYRIRRARRPLRAKSCIVSNVTYCLPITYQFGAAKFQPAIAFWHQRCITYSWKVLENNRLDELVRFPLFATLT